MCLSVICISAIVERYYIATRLRADKYTSCGLELRTCVLLVTQERCRTSKGDRRRPARFDRRRYPFVALLSLPLSVSLSLRIRSPSTLSFSLSFTSSHVITLSLSPLSLSFAFSSDISCFRSWPNSYSRIANNR